MAGAAASPTLEATEVLTGLVTTGVLTGAVEAVLLHVAEVAAEVAGVEAAGVATVFAT